MTEKSLRYYLGSLGTLGIGIAICVYYNIKIGFNRDKEIYEPDFIRIGFWWLLFAIFVAIIFMIFLYLNKKISNKIFKIISTGIATILLLLAIGFGASLEYYYHNKSLDDYKNSLSGIYSINLDDVSSAKEQKMTGIIYVGRDNCSACVEVYPGLIKATERYNVQIEHYNTIEDRVNCPVEMNETLDSLGIISVPSVVIFEDGEVLKLFSGETLLKDLSNYLKDNTQYGCIKRE